MHFPPSWLSAVWRTVASTPLRPAGSHDASSPPGDRRSQSMHPCSVNFTRATAPYLFA